MREDCLSSATWKLRASQRAEDALSRLCCKFPLVPTQPDGVPLPPVLVPHVCTWLSMSLCLCTLFVQVVDMCNARRLPTCWPARASLSQGSYSVRLTGTSLNGSHLFCTAISLTVIRPSVSVSDMVKAWVSHWVRWPTATLSPPRRAALPELKDK